MKKFLLLSLILFISNSFVFAETLKAKAVRDVYTSRENSVLTLKILKKCKINNIQLEKDFFITGTIANITKSDKFYRSASFDFTPISYKDNNGVEHKIESGIKGRFNGKLKPDIEKSPLNFDLNVGGFMPYGENNGTEAFSGVKKMVKEDIDSYTDCKDLSVKDDTDLVEIDMDEVLKLEF